MKSVNSTKKKTTKRALLLGSAGPVANLMIELYSLNNVEVVGLDITKKPLTKSYVKHFIFDLESNAKFSKELIACLNSCDYIVNCLPDDIAYVGIKKIAPHLSSADSLVDTLSAKTTYLKMLQRLPISHDPNIEIISINPLFRPVLGFNENNVAIVNIKKGQKTSAILKYLKNTGSNLVYCDIEEHDKLMAMAQTVPHALLLAYGSFLLESNYSFAKVKKFMTPVQKIILSLVARLGNNNKMLYWDIQKENPFSSTARKQFKACFQELHNAAHLKNFSAFSSIFDSPKEFLGNVDLNKLALYSDFLVNK